MNFPARSPRVTVLALAGAIGLGGACALFPPLDGLTNGDASTDTTVDAPLDASSDAQADSRSQDVDSTDAPLDARITCDNGETCIVGEQVCCVVPTMGALGCVAADAACPDASVALPCDDETDCTALGFPNTYCCAAELPNLQASSVSCQVTCPVSNAKSTRLCNPNPTDEAGICPGATDCGVSQSTLLGIYICR